MGRVVFGASAILLAAIAAACWWKWFAKLGWRTRAGIVPALAAGALLGVFGRGKRLPIQLPILVLRYAGETGGAWDAAILMLENSAGSGRASK